MKSSPNARKFLVTILLTLFVLAAFAVSGFTIAGVDGQTAQKLPPNQGPGDGDELVDVIVNGDFEKPWEPLNGVAPDWEPFSNGQAAFGWYDEQWLEAVRTGEHAQLMEIFMVEASVQSRVIAIQQTVDVAPESTYDLEFYAIMRTQAPPSDRNRDEFEMHWGIDPLGEGDYENVETWNLIPLEEQFRLGSAGEYPDDLPLFYEVVTGTVETADSNRITLFIRGLKKFSTGTEVNFDVDDVSLIGPPPDTEPPAPDIVSDSSMPDTGAALPKNVSGGALALSGLVLVVLGTTAAAVLLRNRKESQE